jgi:hypothetical protein
MKKSWTRRGVFRMNSTYHLAGPLNHWKRERRHRAPIVPTMKLKNNVRIEICRVTRAPLSKSGSSRKIGRN